MIIILGPLLEEVEISIVWGFFLFIFQANELDLVICLKIIITLLNSLNINKLSEADRLKLLQLVLLALT